ncbi:hypothetical protein WICMUC_004396 [Wickerhamomyces mucosus]|uniref:Eukaryotic translation initiation factor 3 subunit A n=1 Tax=Wickerhamomyces mucosus TaxID=1378264 RepID=A0A9P8TAU8_9ASCO|nr:hypothetical protein WICMUC_004396 [Wickerhamomyces mucosus]
MKQNTNVQHFFKRAEELIAVGKDESALQILHEFLISKKTRSVAPSALEPIANLFVQLSVDLRKGHTLKDGLHQFKRNVQLSESGLPFVEAVCRKLVEIAEKKLQDVQSIADKRALEALDDDLEVGESPEDILLSAVSSEQSRERADRELITPWLRFLWEIYRLVLDLLKNNSRLEVTYGAVVQQAFQFCVTYNRKNEFKKLTDNLRFQFPTAQQRGVVNKQVNAIDLQDPETLQRFLDLRFTQLNYSVKLELWQEAFKAVEDTHNLLTASKRPPKPTMMVSYFENLAKIFLVGENLLFHAAAWQRFFNLYSQSPSATDEELSRYSSIFLLSSLSISQDSSDDEFERRRANAQLSSLLNLPKVPTRDSLIQFALNKSVYDYVDPTIKKLYQLLEAAFHPLQTRDELNNIIDEIESNKHFAKYIKPLRKVILTRLFEQVSQVYETVKLDFLVQLATFKGQFSLSPLEIEGFLLNAGSQGRLSFYIDHDAEVVTFVNDPFSESSSSTFSKLQTSPDELIRSQLANLAKTLYASSQYIDPSYSEKQKLLRERLIAQTHEAIAREREEHEKSQRLLVERKQQAEIEKKEREAEASRARLLKIEEEKAAEAKRVEEENKRRLEEKLEREKAALREKEKRRMVEEINAKGIIKVDLNNLEDVDEEKLRLMQIEQLEKDKTDLESRLKSLFKKMDHVERAYRKYELPLLEKDAGSQKERDLQVYEEFKSKKIAQAKKDHEEALQLRNRLQRIVPDFSSFRESISSDVTAKREALIKENAEQLAIAKEERINAVRQERYQQKLAEYETALRREAEDEERKKVVADRLEKENKRRENIEREQKEREAATAKQREIEAIIEAKVSGNTKSSGGAYQPPSRRSAESRPATTPSPEDDAPLDVSKLTFAERMRLKRAGKLK